MKTFVRKHFRDEYGVEFSTCGDITTLTRMPSGLKGAYRIPDFVTDISKKIIFDSFLVILDKQIKNIFFRFCRLM